MSYPLSDIEGIDAEAVAKLRKAKIRSTARLLEAASTAKGRKLIAELTGLNEKNLLCWVTMADRMRVRGVRKEYAELLQAAGVCTAKDLAYRNPANLAEAMSKTSRAKSIRLLPSEKVVSRWIDDAKKLPHKIKY